MHKASAHDVIMDWVFTVILDVLILAALLADDFTNMLTAMACQYIAWQRIPIVSAGSVGWYGSSLESQMLKHVSYLPHAHCDCVL